MQQKEWQQRSGGELPIGGSFLCSLLSLSAWTVTWAAFRRSWYFCLILDVCVPLFEDLTWQPIRIAAHYIAKYSYGIYLTHTAALVVYVHSLQGKPYALRLAALLGILCFVPVLLYHLLEEPMIRLGAKVASRLDGRPSPKVTEQTLNLEPTP